jgi:micrococcal nuclease
MTVRSLRLHQALLWLILIILADPLHASDFTGKVIGITDGNTIKVLVDRTPIKIRLLWY